jgi:hypothetical protein
MPNHHPPTTIKPKPSSRIIGTGGRLARVAKGHSRHPRYPGMSAVTPICDNRERSKSANTGRRRIFSWKESNHRSDGF